MKRKTQLQIGFWTTAFLQYGRGIAQDLFIKLEQIVKSSNNFFPLNKEIALRKYLND